LHLNVELERRELIYAGRLLGVCLENDGAHHAPEDPQNWRLHVTRYPIVCPIEADETEARLHFVVQCAEGEVEKLLGIFLSIGLQGTENRRPHGTSIHAGRNQIEMIIELSNRY
jgi:hypothetical protein